MAVLYLKNSRNPDNKAVPITVSLTLESVLAYPTPVRPEQVEDLLLAAAASGTEFPNLQDPEGDEIWFLIVAAPRDELDKDTGEPIPTQIVNVLSQDTVLEEIEAALTR